MSYQISTTPDLIGNNNGNSKAHSLINNAPLGARNLQVKQGDHLYFMIYLILFLIALMTTLSSSSNFNAKIVPTKEIPTNIVVIKRE